MLKPLTVWIMTNCGKFFKWWEYQPTLPASLWLQLVKSPPAMPETWVQSLVGKIPWRRECHSFQYSGLENSQDCIVHGVAKSQTLLSDFHFTYLLPDKSVCRSRSDRTRHGTTDWLQVGKGVHQHCILSLCLFNLYEVYTIQNIGLDKAQAITKIVGEISITSDMQMTPSWW